MSKIKKQSKNKQTNTRHLYLSNDEYYFSLYLDELKKEGYIVSYQYEPDTITLCQSNEVKINHSLNKKTNKYKTENIKFNSSVSYTPDFKIEWNLEKSDGIFTKSEGIDYDFSTKKIPFILQKNSNISFIEVKPEYDVNNMTRYVKVKLSLIMSLFNIYIQIINYESLYKKTFYPDLYFVTLTGKEKVKIDKKTKTKIPLKNFIPHNSLKDYIETQ